MTAKPDAESVRGELEQLGRELADLEQRRTAAMKRAAELLAQGQAVGVDILGMSKLVGLSRPTIYKMLQS